MQRNRLIYLFIYLCIYLFYIYVLLSFTASPTLKSSRTCWFSGPSFFARFSPFLWTYDLKPHRQNTQGWEHEFRHEIRHELQAVVLSRHVTAAILQNSRPTNQCGWWSKVNIARGTKSANCPWRELTRQRLLRCMASGQPIFPLIFKKSLLNNIMEIYIYNWIYIYIYIVNIYY